MSAALCARCDGTGRVFDADLYGKHLRSGGYVKLPREEYTDTCEDCDGKGYTGELPPEEPEPDDTDCPYWQASNGGPTDLPGTYGPGTCKGGCHTEPRCMV